MSASAVQAKGPKKRNVFDVLENISRSKKVGAKNILVRVDFNVPMSADAKTITDDSRIRGALPTIQAICKAKCNAILVSHMGRPKLVQKGADDDATRAEKKKLSLRPVTDRLSTLLGDDTSVAFAEDCIGAKAEDAVKELSSDGGAVLVLENLRFYKEEEKNEVSFARALASLADAYINDAFGTSHRAHASVSGVPGIIAPEMCGIGCLITSELLYLDFEKTEGSKITALIGGSKVSTKLPVIKGLLKTVDTLVLGGGLAFTFIKAKNIPVGNSLVEDSMVETAKELMKEADALGKNLVLPVDAVCGESFPSGPGSLDDTMSFDLVEGKGVEDGWSGFDIGPKSVDLFRGELKGATKLVFNGPMGVFEYPPYDKGTKGVVDILETITKEGTITVVGGGDSVAALEAFGKTDVVSYISTGGGATLELLAGEILPGVAAIAGQDSMDDFQNGKVVYCCFK
uniref:Phosphoglycerate kinase n=1 Tax=Eucampia antarctica TaxID=49252 RepID=A0A7S2SH60_9STRA|mmetsp:Transcript_7839/g.7412  ORF Transcript_7839/g.7412 Transcript_7839/m.7412 type:complete len:458 (+) Transcript_7839:103-1476(+)|eukprot:CAMPEP_0197827352 /NCGR_PEP_ID=MMETSP1437-20131217/4145_1 /TAXON_ID=49252 ORGANISM="Eucampia antarctica, Strain CCMP1452" /NCGR_SAMPLE_ID=MMETSP1437 /ASSEMBLY_ACC=CAM_ASM_001096 /LENGTH=457 /DNA_ID=CAMNT_0043428159 /DNA_START=89 /DNA_END=1462 /DNA_ORIENTATION=+